MNQVGIDAGQQKPDLAGQAEHVMEPDELDPYWKLRPPSATPGGRALQVCRSATDRLARSSTPRTPSCASDAMARSLPSESGSRRNWPSVAFWRNLHDALFMLWLDSSDYESWAQAPKIPRDG